MLERSTVSSCLIGFTLILVMCLGYAAAEENDSLLASTLFIFKDRACNNEKLRLRCPPGTAISIRWAQFGRPVSTEVLCPPLTFSVDSREGDLIANRSIGHQTSAVNESTALECLASSSLQVVMRLCEDQRRCRVTASPQVFGEDPCPGFDKVLKVGYQCQPRDLITRVACRDSILEIRCASSKHIAIHSALYGYSPGVDVPDCPAETSYDSGCHSACSMQIVTRLCHGRRKCRVEASANIFGTPCQSGTQEYLVVVYACVALRTLKEIQDDIFPYSTCPKSEEDEAVALMNATKVQVTTLLVDQPNATSAFTSEFVPTVSTTPTTKSTSCAEELLQSFIWTLVYIRDNLEKFLLYFFLALCTGALLVLLVITVRLSVTVFHYRRRLKDLRTIERPRSPTEPAPQRTLELDEGEVVIERSVHPSPEPERQQRGTHRRTPSPGSPAFTHMWDSPVFVHVESPHESPVLGQQVPPSPLLESPVWVRVEPETTSSLPASTSPTESPVWQLSEERRTPESLPAAPSSTPTAQVLNGSRPLGETRSLSASYTNPYRHDPYCSERRSRSVRPSRHRLPFD